jgi:hypothetical protein
MNAYYYSSNPYPPIVKDDCTGQEFVTIDYKAWNLGYFAHAQESAAIAQKCTDLAEALDRSVEEVKAIKAELLKEGHTTLSIPMNLKNEHILSTCQHCEREVEVFIKEILDDIKKFYPDWVIKE